MEYKHLVVRVYQSRCIGMMWEHTEKGSLVLILNLVYTRPHIARNSSQLRVPVQIQPSCFFLPHNDAIYIHSKQCCSSTVHCWTKVGSKTMGRVC